MQSKKSSIDKKGRLTFIAVAVFWLAVWWVAAAIINQTLFLPTPLQVVAALFKLCITAPFWQSVFTSLTRIALGFVLGFVAACIFAWLSSMFKFVRTLLEPLLVLVRAIPVASFVILALLWFSGKNLSIFTSFLMTLPIIYGGVLTGVQQVPQELLEMAKVFRLSAWKKFYAIYLPAISSSLYSSMQLAIGMSWKSGIAAEVIGLPAFSIGERLYQSKINLDIPDMFAWTAVTVLLSWVLAKVVLFLSKKLIALLQRGKHLA